MINDFSPPGKHSTQGAFYYCKHLMQYEWSSTKRKQTEHLRYTNLHLWITKCLL